MDAITKATIVWCSVMFPYGFQRQWNVRLEKPHDLMSDRIFNSTATGIFYVLPPIGMVNMVSLLNRIEIKYTNKNKKDYESAYREMFGVNYNTL